MKPSLVVLAVVLIALVPRASLGDEHADHHPGGPAPAPASNAPAGMAGMPDIAPSAAGSMAGNAGPAPSAMGGMGGASGASGGMGGASGGMGGMMAGMMPPAASGGCVGGDCGSGSAAKTPIYPSLMTLPALTPAKRAEIDALATQQINEGMSRLAKGSESLNRATQAGDNAAMQHAVGVMREGLDELGAGVAARRVLAEGKAPRNLALDWFKRDMNLASPIPQQEPHAVLGVTPFHLFTMVLLIAFALAMVAMYFFKMRRAAALFGRLESDKASPPPGGAPPIAGSPGPPAGGAPPEKPPPAGGPPTPKAAESQAPAEAPPPAPPAKPPSIPSAGPAPPAAPGGDTAKIASRASELWQARGRPIGSPDVDWTHAKEDLAKEADKPPPQTPAKASPSSPPSPPAPVAVGSRAVTSNWRGQLRVGSVVTETPSVKTLRLVSTSSDGAMPFTFVPGQFVNVAFSIGGARMNRSYSISSSPTHREYVELTVRREPRGAVSRHIDDLLKVGDEIEAGGPVGRFVFTGAEADSIALIAGGVGITPMMSITRYLTERGWPGDIFFVYACRAPVDFIFQKELASLEQLNPKLHVTVTMSRGEGTNWKGPRGRLTKELLAQSIPNIASRRIHLCGPPSMMESTKAILTELGVPPEQVKTEAFGLAKPPPASPATSSKPTAAATGPLVTFSKNNKASKIRLDLDAGDSPPKQSILELSEELGIGIEFSCRVGTCGVCKVKMTSGEVDMAVEDALDADDKTKNIILACQAKPKGDVVVEA